MKTKTVIEKLQAAHDHFDEVQGNLRRFGAGDTEPDFVYQSSVRAAVFGLPFQPYDERGWQLYTDEPGVKLAAKRLNNALQRVTNVISTAPIGSRPAIMDWCKEYLWRVDMGVVPTTV